MNQISASAGLPVLNRVLSALRPACHALITPQAVVLDAGGGRVRPLVRQCSNPSGGLETQFEAAVADLLQLMDDSGSHGRRLHVVVSDFWARPLVLPLQGQMPSDEDVDVVLQSQYRRIYGDLMGGWHWCWDRQGARLLAVAWPEGGLAALRQGIAQRNGVLASARPLAMDIAAKAVDEKTPSWLAIIEGQSVSLLRQQGGVWEGWCVLPGDSSQAENLPVQLARETARRSDNCRAVTLVDLHGAANTTHLRKTLAGACWVTKTWSPTQADASTGYRLWQAISAGLST